MNRPKTLQCIVALDPRSRERAALEAWQAELVEAIGGEGSLDAVRRELVEQATRLKLYLDRADALYLPGRTTPPVRADQRTTLRRQLSGLLKLLGTERVDLGRKARPDARVPTLEELRTGRYRRGSPRDRSRSGKDLAEMV